MSPFGLEFSQMILHTETSKLMYNWSFLFVVLHKPKLLPSTFIRKYLKLITMDISVFEFKLFISYILIIGIVDIWINYLDGHFILNSMGKNDI